MGNAGLILSTLLAVLGTKWGPDKLAIHAVMHSTGSWLEVFKSYTFIPYWV